jgi:hypothetical protein
MQWIIRLRFVRLHNSNVQPGLKEHELQTTIACTYSECYHPTLSSLCIASLCESHALLDLRNSQRGVQSLGARPRAVENGVASVQAHAVVQGVLALSLLLVSGVGDPAVRLEEDGGTEVLLLVPPV